MTNHAYLLCLLPFFHYSSFGFSTKNLRFLDIARDVISDRLMQATICLETYLKIDVSELHNINEF